MPRRARYVEINVAHHVVCRGVARGKIFRSDADKLRYLGRFFQVAAEEKVAVHKFCLMDNHVHGVLTPSTETGLARLFSRVHTWWAMWFNKKTNRVGHLFQGRYLSSALSESHYWSALRYVDLNPVKAGLVKRAEDYLFSSARQHLGLKTFRCVKLTEAQTLRRYDEAEWRVVLSTDDPHPEHILDLRRHASGCLPCGPPDWIRELERRANRKLTWSPAKRRAALGKLLLAAS